MQTTPTFGLPYAEPADAVASYPASVSQPLATALEGYLSMPAPAETYLSGQLPITSLVRSTETPSQIRASLTNPHPTHRMLVYVKHDTWIDFTAAATNDSVYLDSLLISGGVVALQPNSTRIIAASPVTRIHNGVQLERWIWVPVGVTAICGIGASKTLAGDTMTLNYTRTSMIPIRYE